MKQQLNKGIDKIGAAGTLFAAAACPICFPKLAAIGALFGLGVLAPFEVYFFWGAQFFVLLTVVGQFLAFRRIRNIAVGWSSVLLTILFFVSLYAVVSESLSYFALTGIIFSSVWMLFVERKRKANPLAAN